MLVIQHVRFASYCSKSAVTPCLHFADEETFEDTESFEGPAQAGSRANISTQALGLWNTYFLTSTQHHPSDTEVGEPLGKIPDYITLLKPSHFLLLNSVLASPRQALTYPHPQLLRVSYTGPSCLGLPTAPLHSYLTLTP